MKFLENLGLAASPPRIPFHPMPRGYYPPSNMSNWSSMFSQNPETFLYGSPSILSGYQSVSGTFSGTSPQPIEHGVSTGHNETPPLSVEEFLMMSSAIPNLQPQVSQIPPGGQPQGNQFPPRGKPQGSQILPRVQPQGSQILPGGQPQGQYIPQG